MDITEKLHQAVLDGNLDDIKYCIKNGAVSDADKCFALTRSCQLGHVPADEHQFRAVSAASCQPPDQKA